MNYFKLQLLHSTETAREYWLKHPVQFLMLCRYFGSLSRGGLSAKCERRVYKGHQRCSVQSFRLGNSQKDAGSDISITSDCLKGISQTLKRDVHNFLEGEFVIHHYQVAVRHIAPQITTASLYPVDARHSQPLTPASLYPVAARHSQPLTSASLYPVAARHSQPLTSASLHPVAARHSQPLTTASLYPVAARHSQPLTSASLHPVAARYILPQLSPCWLQSPQRLYSTYSCSKNHSLRSHIFGVSPVMPPACIVDFQLISILGSKNMVRFYRSQRHKTIKQNKNVEEKCGGLGGSTDSGSDEGLRRNIGSGCVDEHESSYMLSPVRRRDGLSDDINLVDTQETMDDSDVEGQGDITTTRKSADEMSLPELSRASFNIVPYVKRSVSLQNLVKIGVNLDKVQRIPVVAEHLIKSNFERDIVPLCRFLLQLGVEANMLGFIFTSNPVLFMESVQDLELRVGYLLHKKLFLKEIAHMVSRAPIVLLMDPVMLDEKMGFLQDVFDLTDREVREVVKLFPKILPWKKELLAEVRFHVHEFIGFTNSEMKQIILKDPKIFVSGKGSLVDRFNYLHNYMQIPHKQILHWPKILRMRKYIVKNRHLFLLYVGRAQYDPRKENYVSMQALSLGTDEEFCRSVAKCHVQEFYDFCKTL